MATQKLHEEEARVKIKGKVLKQMYFNDLMTILENITIF
jgi:hypothetical protein